jgi:hypothetical protein
VNPTNITEIQNTTTAGDKISGELIFRFTDVENSEFLRYRKAIRDLVVSGNIGLSQTVINERALVAANQLEKDPDKFRVAQTPPMPQEIGGDFLGPAARLPGQPKSPRVIPYTPPAPEERRMKRPKIQPAMRAFLLTLVGKEQNEILTGYRERFKQSKFSNQGILDMYNAVHNIG